MNMIPTLRKLCATGSQRIDARKELEIENNKAHLASAVALVLGTFIETHICV